MKIEWQDGEDFDVRKWIEDHPIPGKKNVSVPSKSSEGFPWCSIPTEKFDNFGLRAASIGIGQVEALMGYEYRTFDLTHNRPLKLLTAQKTGFFRDGKPIGVTIAHTFDRGFLSWILGEKAESERLCAELDLVYVRPEQRWQHMGTLLYSMGLLRVLEQKPELLFTHISDKTGRLTKLHLESGYEHRGPSRKYSDAQEFVRELGNEGERVALQNQLEEKIRRVIAKKDE